jgi:hypothetical protein
MLICILSSNHELGFIAVLIAMLVIVKRQHQSAIKTQRVASYDAGERDGFKAGLEKFRSTSINPATFAAPHTKVRVRKKRAKKQTTPKD